MKLRRLPALAAISLCVLAAGCIFKPTTVTTHSYILSPLAAAEDSAPASHLAIGVGIVKLPPYLLRRSVAVREGTNEVRYLEGSLWAEYLDQSFQRTLAANLSRLLHTDRIRQSAWQRHEISLAVYVSIERFDVNQEGVGVLSAWWRLTSPGGDKVLKSGQSDLRIEGPKPTENAGSIVRTLSELNAQLSQTIAQAIGALPPGDISQSQP